MTLAKLALAAVCGGVIGFQRERQDRAAGFRTHILVSLGSALFMIVSTVVQNLSQLEPVTRVSLEEPPESGSQLFGAS